ncbi:UDP-N-acetyl-2-amino-2-deoxyglucuronate dehydrogenase [Enterococcus sp. PF1-24]|uniref:Gfo/Idh/MocA family protein n=1 Tax=unclassified Enterococcus TaxID=2608891 RepID=UPI002475FFBF|nr:MULTISPECIES: Gfo/Idh/MocA family oxidoreductase [unclassified Enterococcus]MDH6363990.1 UDP-N-acetyl-2-amino-2-deoxyglucuronate dehydrogenase [Enterococcus sp. PFB1-1]MDH6401091.1 UDP-N-acetyl-2-amino-2-deoxyglucuronate dehydrogenase [Enterococcus sp. PF1-24]
MINFGLIGCGNISRVHAEALKVIDEACLVAVCDIDERKGKQLATEYQTDFYQDYQDLLASKNIDAIIIATPHYLHKEMTLQGLAADKHVICEKPMAITVTEAEEICRAVQLSKKNYAVCYQNRFNPSFVKFKQLLLEGRFNLLKGLKCEVTWHRDLDYYREADWKGTWQEEGGGVLINQAIHTLDVISWFVKCPQKIKGKIMTSLLENDIEVEDAAMATALIDETVPVVIHASNNYSSDPTPIVTFDFGKDIVRLSNKELWINNQNVLLATDSDSVAAKDYWGNGHQRLIQTFVNKITGASDPYLSYLASEDAIDSLMMVCGIYDSDRKNQWVELIRNVY